ncbi:ATP-grasp domain-containing protein [Candidatus Contubernalis alkaliaceticus]|uniref:ATP-grasp domain-containing protein n=1 Tax=Candidatus Contubernalis alkaliaceticus TaxID=338645 RepID=UPI001F4C0A87|nr:ATP-grasp domain-containing protein [Candidatus Contubernalis alkalaceticus]UNC93617.1 ATP-grasp domain-containing protein [Candidatus Contubernalis alkalaceticus]
MTLNIMLTSIGRRGQMVNFFKENLRGEGKVFTADCDPTAPGLYLSHRGFVVPRVNEADYLETILELCSANDIKAVVPFIDPELPILAEAAPLFASRGIKVMISSPEAVNTAMDKYKTFQYFKKQHIPTVETWLAQDSQDFSSLPYPLIVKPRQGSASQGVHRVQSKKELDFALAQVENPVIQHCLKGQEITMDMFCHEQGSLIQAVPRRRIKVRGGEVERAITVFKQGLLDWAPKIAKGLKLFGPVNIQCFIEGDKITFTEINCRFGGGYPLSYYAGANFVQMIIKLTRGEPLEIPVKGYEPGLVMMRYEETVIKREEDLI